MYDQEFKQVWADYLKSVSRVCLTVPGTPEYNLAVRYMKAREKQFSLVAKTHTVQTMAEHGLIK